MAPGKEQLEYQNSQGETVVVNAADEPTEGFVMEFGGKEGFLAGLADNRTSQVDLKGIATGEKNGCILPYQDIGRIYVSNDTAGFDHRMKRPGEIDRRPDKKPPIRIGKVGALALWAGERRDRKAPSNERHDEADRFIAAFGVEQSGRPGGDFP
jgi:hypothetical protein